ncbi:MAG TPA: penicillin-binding protein activator, partial [Nitrososphaera sp.]
VVAAGNALFFAIMVSLIYQSSYLATQRGVLMFSTLVAYPAVHALVMVPAITILVASRSGYLVDKIFQLISILILVLSDSWLAAAFLSHSLDLFWLSDLFFVIDYVLLVAGLFWYAYFNMQRQTSLTQRLRSAVQRVLLLLLTPYATALSPSSSSRNKALTVSIALTLLLSSSVIVLACVIILTGLENASSNRHNLPAAGLLSEPATIRLGALLPLTGIWSSTGESQRSAVEKAITDMNSYFHDHGQNETVDVLVQDTRSDPGVALERLRFLESQGVKVVLGPQTSAEVAAVKEYADSHGILVLSTGSTAPSLSIRGDNVFRLVPDDSNQGLVAEKLMQNDGIKVVVPMWRDDTYGNDLVSSMKKHFQDEGGVVMEGVSYRADTGAFSSSLNRMNFVIWERDLKKLESQVSQATSLYGAKSVAVYLVAFDEATPIFIQANDHEVLRSVRWYGGDGIANNKAMLGNPAAMEFASQTDFKIPAYIADVGGNGTTDKATAPRPVKYDDVLYDATRIASLAEASLQNRTGDFAALKTAIVRTATQFDGVSGKITLNDAGDRIFDGAYGYTKVTKHQNGTFSWDLFVN